RPRQGAEIQAARAREHARDLRQRRRRLQGRAVRRPPYEGVALGAPVTVPYERYSIKPAQRWIGRALRMLIEASGIAKQDIDGLIVSSFTLAPDTAVGLTQHYGLSPR